MLRLLLPRLCRDEWYGTGEKKSRLGSLAWLLAVYLGACGVVLSCHRVLDDDAMMQSSVNNDE